jgi:plastocyanin
MNTEKLSRRRFVSAIGSVALVGLAGCSGGQAGGTPTETPASPPNTPEPTTTTPEPTTTEQTEEAGSEQPVVRMVTDNEGSYFDPKGLLLEPGTTVTFVNASGSHSATAYHPENG